jgi:hypothetical protein
MAVTVLYTVGWGFRRLTLGLPFFSSARQLLLVAGEILTGALLSPLVLLLFHRVRATPRAVPVVVLLYLLIGVGFWLAWASAVVGLGHLGVLRLAPTPPTGGRLLTAAVFSAYICLTLYAVMVMLFEAMHYLQESRRKGVEAAQLHAELSKAQTAAVVARLNPDFLFQTFAAASGLVDHDVRAARRMLSNLSELLRVSLGSSGSPSIELRDELHLLHRHVEIQQARFGDRLQFESSVDLQVSSWRVPPLLLQPLMEGLTRSLDEQPDSSVRVRISASVVEGWLRIVFTSRSEPPPTEHLHAELQRSIEHLRSRLEAVYGSTASVSLAATSSGQDVLLAVPMPDAAILDGRRS